MTLNLPDTQRRLLTDSEQRLHAAREHDAGAWQEILAAERVNETLPRVWACSGFTATACLRTPELLRELVRGGALFERAADDWFTRDVRERVSGASEAEVMEALRRFRRRHMVRIAWRDIAGWADLDETLRDLSNLADACVQFSYRSAYDQLVARYGVPRGEQSGESQPMLIFGMGKLGGGELNYSSDIDLVFLYPEEGQTDGARSVDNAEFFLRLGQKITQLLAAPTA